MLQAQKPTSKRSPLGSTGGFTSTDEEVKGGGAMQDTDYVQPTIRLGLDRMGSILTH